MTGPRSPSSPAPTPLALLLLAPLALGSCGKAGSSGVRVERADSAGIQVVTNRGPDIPLDWTFEPRLRLRGADERPEAFGTIQVDTDAAGNLYVQDRSRFRVSVFDPDGRHVRDVGTKGAGPGEIPDPFVIGYGGGECRISVRDAVEARGIAEFVPAVRQIAVAPDGTLWVGRSGRYAPRRLIDIVSPEGEYGGTLETTLPFPAAFTPEGDPVVVERDELDLSYVVVYRVRR